MKSLTQFIKESQEINESLFGDIIRKLLDTGLSWIEGSVKWIADKSADAVGEVWKTRKDTLGTVYSDFRRTHPQYNFLPEMPNNPKDYALLDISILYNKGVTAEHKIDYATNLINSFKTGKHKSKSDAFYIAFITASCYVGIVKNKKVTSGDKVKADNFVNKVKSSVDDNTKNLIDSNIQSYMAKI